VLVNAGHSEELMSMSDSPKPESQKSETEKVEPKPVELEIRKLDKLETTYVRNCTG
jgi:hypothetical protein